MTMPRYIAAQPWQPQRIYETRALSVARVVWQVAAGFGIVHSAFCVIVNFTRLIAGTTDDVVGSAWLDGGVANTFLRVVLTGLWCAACIVCELSLDRLGGRAETQAHCWEYYVLSLAASAIAVGLAMQFINENNTWAVGIPACTMGIPALCAYFAIKHRRLVQQHSHYLPPGYLLPYGAPMVTQQPVPMPYQQLPVSASQPPQGSHRLG